MRPAAEFHPIWGAAAPTVGVVRMIVLRLGWALPQALQHFRRCSTSTKRSQPFDGSSWHLPPCAERPDNGEQLADRD
ncbi:MAG TPA: hypothetical protein VGU64_17365 [Terriglobales bacterium]|nr:hypothetical protein [Terriglobales bacterium]